MLRNKSLYFIVIFLILIKKLQGDCIVKENGICKLCDVGEIPSVIKDRCYSCYGNAKIDSSNGNSYELNYGGYGCTQKNCTGRIIAGTYECVTSCPPGYVELGVMCYEKMCPQNSEIDLSKNGKICKCKYYYTEHYLDNDAKLSVLTCYGLDEYCPDSNIIVGKKCYDYIYLRPLKLGRPEDNEWDEVKDWAKKELYRIYFNNKNEINFEGLDKCGEGEVIEKPGRYIEAINKLNTEDPFGSDVSYCVKKCDQKFYTPVGLKENICTDCLSSFYFPWETYSDVSKVSIFQIKHEKDKTCRKDCPKLITMDIKEGEKNGHELKCTDLDTCPVNFPYLYKGKYCFKKCSLIQQEIIFPDSDTNYDYDSEMKPFEYNGPSPINPSVTIHVCLDAEDCSKFGYKAKFERHNGQFKDRYSSGGTYYTEYKDFFHLSFTCVPRCNKEEYKYNEYCFPDWQSLYAYVLDKEGKAIEICNPDSLNCGEPDQDYFVCRESHTLKELSKIKYDWEKISLGNYKIPKYQNINWYDLLIGQKRILILGKQYYSTKKNCDLGCPSGSYGQINGDCGPSCSGKLTIADGKIRKCVDFSSEKKCPDNYPYEYHSKSSGKDEIIECFFSEIGCRGYIDRKEHIYPLYQMDNNQFQCYEDCDEIDSWNHLSNYILVDDYICVLSDKCPPTHIYSLNDYNLCFKNSCPEDYYPEANPTLPYYNCVDESCSSNYPYFQEEKCVSSCHLEKYPYVIERSYPEPGYCLKNFSECQEKEYNYFSLKNGYYVCRKRCKQLKLEIDPSSNLPYFRKDGNCISKKDGCPPEFPFRFKSTCYKKCPSGKYYDPNGSKKCTDCSKFTFDDKCLDTCYDNGEYKFNSGESSGECLKQCPNYYKEDSKEKKLTCVENCESGKFDSETKKCLPDQDTPDESTSKIEGSTTSCPKDRYYSENDGKCHPECPENEYQSATNNHICVDKCEEGESLDKSLRKCLKDECPYYYYNYIYPNYGTQVKVCVESCEEAENGPYKYVINDTKECVNFCPWTYNYLSDGYCYNKCPGEKPFKIRKEGTDDLHFYFECFNSCFDYFHYENDDNCIEECKAPRNYIIEGENTCYDKCPAPYTYIDLTHYPDYILCFNKCDKVKVGNKCIEKCNRAIDDRLIYYDDLAKECFEKCPPDKPFFIDKGNYYECVTECNDEQVVLPTNECSKSCPSSFHFIGKDKKCKTKCDPNFDGKYYGVNKDYYGFHNYMCMDACDGFIISGGEDKDDIQFCLTFQKCEDYNLFESPSGKCLVNCILDPIYKFTLETEKKCTDICPYNKPYHNLDNKCLDKCEDNTYYINEENLCVESCIVNSDSPFKYYIQDGSEENIKCLSICPSDHSRIIITNTGFKCVKKCPSESKYLNYGNICKKFCDPESETPFTPFTNEEEIKCIERCPSEQFYYKDKKCLDKCNKAVNGKDDPVLEGTNICIETEECKKDNFIYYPPSSPKNFNRNTCVHSCMKTDLQFSKDRICISECPSNYHYLEEDNICIEGRTCPDKYMSEKRGEPIIKCVNICTIKKTLEESAFYFSGKCVKNCAATENKYFAPPNNTCIKSCEEGYFKYQNSINTLSYQCLKNCKDAVLPNSASALKPYADKDKNCVKTCNANYPYVIGVFEFEAIDTQQVCLESCPSSYPYIKEECTTYGSPPCNCLFHCENGFNKFYVIESTSHQKTKVCKEKCEGDYEYEGDFGECFKKCPPEKPYYEYDKKICLNRCPNGKVHKKNRYKCIEKCPRNTKYVDYDSTTCIDSCSTPFFGKDIYKDKIEGRKNVVGYCLKECNEEFGFLLTPNNECVKSCSETSSDFNSGDLILDKSKKQCVCKNLYYKDKNNKVKCIDSSINTCGQQKESESNYLYGIENDPNRCVNTCEGVISTENICIENENYECQEETSVKKIDQNTNIKKCQCKYNYYRKAENDPMSVVCLKKDEACPDKFKYILQKENRCVEECNEPEGGTFLNYCFDTCPIGTKQDGEKCIPTNNWYIEESNKHIVTYSVETSVNECPNKYPYLIEETKQCVKKCEGFYYILFENKCISNCENLPTSSKDTVTKTVTKIPEENPLFTVSNYQCQCQGLWYFENDIKKGYKCLSPSIPEKFCRELDNLKFNYQIYNTNECVKECPKNYPYLYNGYCYKDCSEPSDTNDGYELIEDTKNHKCLCPGLWRKKDDYPDFYECILDNYCPKYDGNEYMMIYDTKECVIDNMCPYGYVKSNHICYKTEICSGYSETDVDKDKDEDNNVCQCIGLWYYKPKKEDNTIIDIICLDEKVDECPHYEFPYMDFKTKECLTKCDEGKSNKIFNYKCYERCPLNTVSEENEEAKDSKDKKEEKKLTNCVCDKDSGNWYKYYKNERYHLSCGLSECPKEFPYEIKETKECVINCLDKKITNGKIYTIYKNVCYENSCPDGTVLVDEKSYLCEDINIEVYADNIENIHNYVSDNILKLYNQNTKGGFLYEKFNITLQIVSLSKNYLNLKNKNKESKTKRRDLIENEENNDTNITIPTNTLEDYYSPSLLYERSNLSLINIDQCIEKIYQSNTLELSGEDAEILVAKYDIHNASETYLINPVEYEFFSSKTGNKIDASICNRGEIIIGYPLVLNKKNWGLSYDKEKKEQLNKIFNIGKKLYSENKNYDLFNKSSEVFSEMCKPFVIEEKDVTIQDRRKYLYPNITVCENNCSYYFTDYDTQRVYCKCLIKSEFYFDRKIKNSTLIQKQQTFSKKETDLVQKGPTNFPVLKCIKNMKTDTKNTIKENEIFSIGIVLFILEIILIFVTAFYSYKKINSLLSFKIDSSLVNNKVNIVDRHKNNDDDISDSSNTTKKMDDNINNDNYNISYVSNPPKKNEEDSERVGEGEEKKKEKEKVDNNPQNIVTIAKLPQYRQKKSNKGEKGLKKDIDKVYYYNRNYTNDYFNSDSSRKDNNLQEDDEKEKLYQGEVTNTDESLFRAIYLQDVILRNSYEKTLKTDKNNIFVMVVTEMLTRVYLVKTFFLLKKYDSLSLLIALYLFYHMILLALTASFFDINKISKIYTEKDFPNLSYYLLYGFVTLIISWVFYGIMKSFVSLDERVRKFLKNKVLTKERTGKTQTIIDKNLDKFRGSMKRNIAGFFAIGLVITLFCWLYLVIFFGVYIKTKKYVYVAYFVTLAEIMVIKFVYGLIIGILRFISIQKRIRCLYETVRIFDAYFI